MHPFDARQLALQLMQCHHLLETGWRFAFDHARRRFGCCNYTTRVISLSRPLVLLNDEQQVRDTILHEIAHALCPDDGHGPRWRQVCRAIGAKPQRCYGDEQVVTPPRRPAPYRFGCTRCSWWVDRRRLSRRKYRCAHCSGPLVFQHRVNSTGVLQSDARY